MDVSRADGTPGTGDGLSHGSEERRKQLRLYPALGCRHCVRFFAYMLLFDANNNPKKWALLVSQILGRQKQFWGDKGQHPRTSHNMKYVSGFGHWSLVAEA